MNKTIHRDHQTTNKIFDNRSLEKDYATLIPILKNGLRVLDIGCGTGAISKDIAERVGPEGSVTGIDNTEKFIVSGKESYQTTLNLQLIHHDLFSYETQEKFDLIVSARTLQWLSNPKEALLKFKSLLKPGGQLSILDYNHEQLSWQPQPPESMLTFYQTFLRWRADAGMNNHIAEDLAGYFAETGFQEIEVFNAEEVYQQQDDNFLQRIGIWSKVAGSTQMVEEGYLEDSLRLKAIEEYDQWIVTDAEQMIMKLKEVRGKTPL
ncbi:methyltransferase domain-containing protein [Pedobacter cryoconitis]|uniref:Ubiquinone/menaquinone biosynthesis C-methylase UbiE n=1 Tax=Pedobacter cryoconitis TaxID=188932 RepID=A0A327STG7_9SPHI|nr:methyltransferase domain-containing protein [Pedobacter cryoconitis]RAJ32251.1 ubiquinone/menaquinone biosynthesis C-methylase UbiE [Pedobacter cryoconitis]